MKVFSRIEWAAIWDEFKREGKARSLTDYAKWHNKRIGELREQFHGVDWSNGRWVFHVDNAFRSGVECSEQMNELTPSDIEYDFDSFPDLLKTLAEQRPQEFGELNRRLVAFEKRMEEL